MWGIIAKIVDDIKVNWRTLFLIILILPVITLAIEWHFISRADVSPNKIITEGNISTHITSEDRVIELIEREMSHGVIDEKIQTLVALYINSMDVKFHGSSQLFCNQMSDFLKRIGNKLSSTLDIVNKNISPLMDESNDVHQIYLTNINNELNELRKDQNNFINDVNLILGQCLSVQSANNNPPSELGQ